MTMIEKVARVIAAKVAALTSDDYNLDYQTDSGESAAEVVARAVLVAMREPTPEMLAAFR